MAVFDDEKDEAALKAALESLISKGMRALLCIIKDEGDEVSTALFARSACMHDYALAIGMIADVVADAACNKEKFHGPS